MQERCGSLETSLAECQAAQAASLLRQQDLEYELGRAWEELERAEAALQHQRAQQEVEGEQQEAQLVQARQVRKGEKSAAGRCCHVSFE